MPYDTLTLACVLDEARTALIGARIQRILQPGEHSVAFAAYGNHQTTWALLSADPRHARFVLSRERFAKAFDEPSPFVMLLRKYLEGGHIVDIRQSPGERIASISIAEGGARYDLMIEIMGRHSNVILLDGNRILGAVKHITPRQSRVRTILPGREYVAPPVQPPAPETGIPARLDPAANGGQVLAALRIVPPSTPVRDALLGLLRGISPFLAGQIVRTAGLSPDARIDHAADLDRVVARAEEFYTLPETQKWSPSIFVDERNRVDFAPYAPLGMSDLRSAESMSQAIEEAVGADESRDVLRAARRRLLTDIDHRRSVVARRLHSLRGALSATGGAQEVMERGQFLLAYQHLERHPDSLRIPDLDLTIPLRRELTIQENAEHLFKRYRKLRDAARRVPGLVTEAEREEAQLADLAAFVPLAETEADLRELERQLRPDQPAKTKAKKPPAKRGPRRLEMDGYTAILGRNARENDQVTFSESRRDDLWLHARGRTGAHVLLRPASAPDDILTAAAALAAYHSEGRTDSAVDVDVTAVRNVRRIPGGAPGRVTYRDFRTLRVEPDRGPWRSA